MKLIDMVVVLEMPLDNFVSEIFEVEVTFGQMQI